MIVTITCKEGNKIIERHDVDIPKKANWIAQDEDGQFCWFSKRPVKSPYSDNNWWVRLFLEYGLLDIGYIWQTNPDWKDSITKVSDIK